MKQNQHLQKLSKSYLFAEIAASIATYKKDNPDAELLNLSIGDTSIPLPVDVAQKIADFATGLATVGGYTGYQDEKGMSELRVLIAATLYKGLINSDEIFVSDGAKGDIGRIQTLFAGVEQVYVQDPTYPVYVDGTTLQSDAEIIKLSCTHENDFFIDYSQIKPHSLLYLCSPNNPTGTVATKAQLTELVAHLRSVSSFLIFDSAYRFFIDGDLPRSIYEIPGAKEVAIEVSSFSKFAGFTGVRLGYTIVPKELKYSNGAAVIDDFSRVHSTIFNGASILAQAGGIAVLKEGFEACTEIVKQYKENAQLLRCVLENAGYCVFGGEHAPYLFVSKGELGSSELFDRFIQKYQIIGVPGSGFGKSGNGYLRLSSFFHPSLRETLKLRLESGGLVNNF